MKITFKFHGFYMPLQRKLCYCQCSKNMVLLLIIVTFIYHSISKNTISRWLQCSYVDQISESNNTMVFLIQTLVLIVQVYLAQNHSIAMLHVQKTWYYYSILYANSMLIYCMKLYVFIYHGTPKNTTPHWLDCPYVIHSENNSSNTMIFWIYTIVLNVYHIHIPYYFKVIQRITWCYPINGQKTL